MNVMAIEMKNWFIANVVENFPPLIMLIAFAFEEEEKSPPKFRLSNIMDGFSFFGGKTRLTSWREGKGFKDEKVYICCGFLLHIPKELCLEQSCPTKVFQSNLQNKQCVTKFFLHFSSFLLPVAVQLARHEAKACCCRVMEKKKSNYRTSLGKSLFPMDGWERQIGLE